MSTTTLVKPKVLKARKDTYVRKPYTENDEYVGINWISTLFITIPPFILVWAIFNVEAQMKTILFAFAYYYCCGISITGGYHRLFSHKAYKGHWLLKVFFTCFGAGALEGSVIWWSRNHRAHHSFSDTSKDPYNVHRGFMWAHVGWMIFKRDYKYIGNSDIEDLKNDPILQFQHKYYLLFTFVFGIALSTIIPGLLWDDWLGGFYYASLARIIFVHHATFCVNSLAHSLGEQTYSDYHSAMDSIFTAVVTLGEGYHNFHHEFPDDYRNGIRWFHYDPTKWFIRTLSFFGITYNLRSWPADEIEKSMLQMKQRKVKKLLRQQQYPTFADYPVIPKKTFSDNTKSGKNNWVIVRNRVVDITGLMDVRDGGHPGGLKILKDRIGKDITKDFFGESKIHYHSETATTIMETNTVGLIEA